MPFVLHVHAEIMLIATEKSRKYIWFGGEPLSQLANKGMMLPKFVPKCSLPTPASIPEQPTNVRETYINQRRRCWKFPSRVPSEIASKSAAITDNMKKTISAGTMRKSWMLLHENQNRLPPTYPPAADPGPQLRPQPSIIGITTSISRLMP